ncbi:MAG: methyltransferase domain-containing protein [Planctomycetales bacterium]|nr:methyltransferase domain-containing protein [Planctomycetales bacterium]
MSGRRMGAVLPLSRLCCAATIALTAGGVVLPVSAALGGEPMVVPSQSNDAERAAPRLHKYMGRIIAPTMHYSHAGWLTRPERDREEAPDRLLALLSVQRGQQVCDFGCGNGYHTVKLARLVGPTGRVLAIDIQPEMLDLLRRRTEPRGLTNIEPALATEGDGRLPAAALDLVLMVDVYHELDDPAGVLAQVRSSLSPRGRVALVEFRAEDPEVPIQPLHKMEKPQIQAELTANGFKLVEQHDELPWQHLLLYARDDSPLPAVVLSPWLPRPE